METQRSNQPNRFKVIGPVGAEEAQAAQPYFDAQPRDCGAQYLNCRKGGGRAKALLYHLIDRETGDVAGFMGFECTVEALGNEYPANGHISFEYVYVVSAYRKLRLGRYFLWRAIAESRKWIQTQVIENALTGIIFRSSSVPVTKAGVRFIKTFDRRLGQWCSSKHFEFKTHEGI